MENVITLKSTQRGLAGSYIWYAFWTFFAPVAIYVYQRIFYSVVNSYTYFEGMSTGEILNSSYLHRVEPLEQLLVIGLGILLMLYIFIGLPVLLVCFFADLYESTTKNIIDKNKKTITETSYSWPYKFLNREFTFDRVVRVDVMQNTMGTLLNTGTLTIHTLTYANSDTVKNRWVIPYIKDPFKAKEQILNNLPGYEGLAVQVKSAPANI